ncbi:hypothetical protein [Nonomuraea soli]|uniref:Uncharacterized protein n=1 Tax=Nonomuraea soli TaxID=1032476 RepID=A0A7W0CFI1_9ACTN|nr:hypothetical protein [Nonomuraea soli]MBA2890233.1 hypothetical protein [Nonomuraea soli]
MLTAIIDVNGVSPHHEIQGFGPQQWPVVAHAVCAQPPPGLRLVTVTELYDSAHVTRARRRRADGGDPAVRPGGPERPGPVGPFRLGVRHGGRGRHAGPGGLRGRMTSYGW